jgi:hypothetical protein
VGEVGVGLGDETTVVRTWSCEDEPHAHHTVEATQVSSWSPTTHTTTAATGPASGMCSSPSAQSGKNRINGLTQQPQHQ